MIKYISLDDTTCNEREPKGFRSAETGKGEGPASEHKPEPPPIQLIDEPSVALRRPLDLLKGRGYAAIVAQVKPPDSEPASGRRGRSNSSAEADDKGWLVVRDDGFIFGIGGDRSMAQLRFPVCLNDPIPNSKRWRADAVQKYRNGSRPDPVDVFHRIESVYDRFIDFDRSLADQETMCRLSACFSLVTWFLSAFSVIGYPWVTGEKGSGKTQWGQCWAETSYLGQVTTAGSTFATLRDLADYSAALVFDDAENLAHKQGVDPDKRALILAGNRRGAQLTLKEPKGEKGWQTRYVNAFGPRGFTAIERPEGVLASRCIVIPLVRTVDPGRGNLTPADFDRWPCNREDLQDDLWALSLHLMREAKKVWAELDNETELVGREFEPWRPILAVARLFERLGVDGLEADIRAVMRAAMHERKTFNEDDPTIFVIRALIQIARRNDTSDTRDASSGEIRVTAAEVAQVARSLATEAEASFAKPVRAVSKILASLRLHPQRNSQQRWWCATKEQLAGLARGYGLAAEYSDSGAPAGDEPLSGEDVTNVARDTAGKEGDQ